MNKTPQKTVERLIQYRRIVQQMRDAGQEKVFSHQIARVSGASPAQIRRDLMGVGYSGSPAHGYIIHDLLQGIYEFLGLTEKKGACIVGLGSLGRAILGYFHEQNPVLKIKAAFDTDPAKTGIVFHGTLCHPASDMASVIRDKEITVAILTVPVEQAQQAAQQLVYAGIRGILNYAPVVLDIRPDIFVENRDMIQAVEKVAYFSK
ncbi:redox-sensing transcriptional repressor Rex [bacterium]|nr:redox-sensing transcriptional repressor Rex [bacterium]